MHKRNLVPVLFVLLVGQGIWGLNDLDLAEKLGLEGVVVAVAAVVLAIQHARDLDIVVDELQGVARSLPTRGLGVFPHYMPMVAELTQRAQKSIKILCDTPAHGAFSSTVAFEEYLTSLRHKMVDGIKVECTFFDPPGREQLHWAQIRADKGTWSNWQGRNQKNCESFSRLASHSGITPPSNGQQPLEAWADTPESYVKSMMKINEVAESVLEDNSTAFELLEFEKPLHEGPTVYFWLRDEDQEAVFVIVPVRGIGVRDLAGFHTREPELIRALDTVYAHRSEGGQKRVAIGGIDAQL
ncbi:MAG TPA: hypothetical protein VF125_10455 [Solirubrobacterales bacterium]